MTIVWTDESIAHLQQIKDYISQDSSYWANLEIERILERAETLSSFPRLGRTVPEYDNETIREIFEGDYRIIYRIVSEQQLDIIGIIHGAKRLQKEDD